MYVEAIDESATGEDAISQVAFMSVATHYHLGVPFVYPSRCDIATRLSVSISLRCLATRLSVSISLRCLPAARPHAWPNECE